MKKILFAALVFMLSGIAAHAQWTRLDLPPGSYRDIFFSAEKTGFLVGDSGMVLKTVDDGVTWRKIDVGVKTNLNGVHFPSVNVGYIAGDSVLLKTTDGGETWEVRKDSIFVGAKKILFVTESIGFFENSFGYRTTDGGKTWETTRFIKKYFFINSAVGFSFEDDVLLKTIDSGATWQGVVPLYSYDLLVPNICWFSDENNGSIGGVFLGGLTSTFDGGKTWIDATSPKYSSVLKDKSGSLGGGIFDIYFPSKNIGYAVGDIKTSLANSNNEILKTKDGGMNWTVVKIDTSLHWGWNSEAQVYFTNEQTGYLAGGQVLKTTTGGEEPVSVQEPLLKTISLNISPNPFKNSARIELPENLLKTEIRIMTANGENCSHCFKTHFEENSIIIERSEAAAGVYFYTIESDGRSVVEGKFVVE